MMPSLLPIDEPVVRWQGTVRAWQGIARMPETSGVNLAAILAHINRSCACVDTLAYFGGASTVIAVRGRAPVMAPALHDLQLAFAAPLQGRAGARARA